MNSRFHIIRFGTLVPNFVWLWLTNRPDDFGITLFDIYGQRSRLAYLWLTIRDTWIDTK